MTSVPCSPGEHPHNDQPNFGLSDYLQMVKDGEAQFSLSEVSRITGLSRMYLHRAMLLATVSDDEFEAIMDDMDAAGKPRTLTALGDEVKRRTGKAREYAERCPHCDGVLRTRRR